MSSRPRGGLGLALALLGLAACRSKAAPPQAQAQPVEARAPLTRAEFNRAAVRANVPLFWRADDDHDGLPGPAELDTLLFYPASGAIEVVRGRELVLSAAAAGRPSGLLPEAAERRKLVEEDLDEGAPTLVRTDLRAASPEDKKLYAHALDVARGIDDLYATMRGAKALAARVPGDDLASQSLFRRNWGPQCVGAKTRQRPECSAIPGAPRPTSDAYPASLQDDPGFCAKLEQGPDAAVLADHFSVVRERGGHLVSVPYTEAYAGPMRAVARALRAAADDEHDPREAALVAYLRAAADGFTTNDWAAADEAWSRMNAQDSRWYVRVAPDEVLADPCKVKAQFHMTFARIDPDSLAWQAKLTPLQGDMEKAFAAAIGPAYTPRAVAFHLPDFIDVVFNAGDDRQPVGATAGESLPNWGKVADEGRGRTVAMVNLGDDADSRDMRRAQIASLVDAASMQPWSDEPEGALLGTILHEATHNLGPTDVYLAGGRKPEAIFGGKLAAMLEELKAETGAMYYLAWLRARGVVTPEQERRGYAAWLAWCFRHVATGVRSGAGDEPYAQLAAIQLGLALDGGAIAYAPGAPTASGKDRGAFSVRYEALPDLFAKMLKTVGTIKAAGDRGAAEDLVARYVDGAAVPKDAIAERVNRFPRGSMVYAVEL